MADAGPRYAATSVGRRDLTAGSFLRQHPDRREPLAVWYDDAHAASWCGPADIKSRYASASFLAGNRVVFSIGGNKYRLVVRINYRPGIAYVRFVGTQAEYDHIHAETI